MSDANREVFDSALRKIDVALEKLHREAFNEGLEAAAIRLENGSFLHDEAPDFLLSKQAAKAIRAMKLPEPQP